LAQELALRERLRRGEMCVGHSAGLHRGVIHATYRASPVVRGALAYLFALSDSAVPSHGRSSTPIVTTGRTALIVRATSPMSTPWRVISGGTCTCASFVPTT